MKAHAQLESLLISATLWLRIVLSYCVIGASLVTLSSAYFQEIITALIVSVMFVSLIIGICSAEIIRRKSGLKQYHKTLHQQQHLRY